MPVRLMAGRRSLEAKIGVQIPDGQQIRNITLILRFTSFEAKNYCSTFTEETNKLSKVVHFYAYNDNLG